MIVVPPFMGIVLSGFHWAHILLLAFWWTGYFAFYAVGLWLRSGRKPRYAKPALVYSVATAVTGLTVLITSPFLMRWVPWFLPLIAITAWASTNRKDRTMRNDMATILAAGLMVPVTYDLGVVHRGLATRGGFLPGEATNAVLPGVSYDGDITGWPWVWTVTLFATAYFVGTAFYVKTNIRERGNENFFWLAVIYHALFALAATAMAGLGSLHFAHALVWWLLVTRTYVVATISHHTGRRIKASILGVGEILATLLVAWTLLM